MKARTLVATAALATFLCAATALATQGRIYGYFKDGVYTAPGKLFKVSSPFPEEPMVSDGREKENNNAGAVTFIDISGRLNGILYMENDAKLAAASEGATYTRQLGSWFRDTGFPGFFKVSIPDAKILREAEGQIAGQPAWIAVAHLPKASPLGLRAYNSLETVRKDSWRGMAVVAHGKHFYLLQTELRVEALAEPGWTY